jgi:hypothetical protein
MTPKQKRDAFRALAVRLWCEDLPEDMHLISSVEEWSARLPAQERWALRQISGD